MNPKYVDDTDGSKYVARGYEQRRLSMDPLRYQMNRIQRQKISPVQSKTVSVISNVGLNSGHPDLH